MDSVNPSVVPHDCVILETQDKSCQRSPARRGRSPAQTSSDGETIIGGIDHSSTPIRPPASDPPTPEPESAVSTADSYQSNFAEYPGKRSLGLGRALSSRPFQATTTRFLPLPEASGAAEQYPIERSPTEKGSEIRHLSPRKLDSHSLTFLQTSDLESSSYLRNESDSPGPPPRSPLRPRRDSRTIENMLTVHSKGRTGPKTAPVIKDVNEYKALFQPRATVITECTGPIKRPKSRGKSSGAQSPSRKDREEQTRARKLRDRPIPSTPIPPRTIDAVIAPLPSSSQRLKKARPHIQIPDLRPVPLATRAASPASTNASWKIVKESTRTAVPSQDTPTTNGEKTGYTPISPTASNGSRNAETRMALSPVMLVAEEIPVQKTSVPPKPARLVVKASPRPRSASIPRSAVKRRSRQGDRTPTRPTTPTQEEQQDDVPPLPSPPPNRALPPTPPASESEKPRRVKRTAMAEYKKELPLLPAYENHPTAAMTLKRGGQPSHMAAQTQNKASSFQDAFDTSHIHARLEALEKQNTRLIAILENTLRPNGVFNAPILSLTESEVPPLPMTFRSRVARESALARKSAASHTASSSNDSALEVYINGYRARQ